MEQKSDSEPQNVDAQRSAVSSTEWLGQEAELRYMALQIAETVQFSYHSAIDYEVKRNRYIEEKVMPILRRHLCPNKQI